jgi:hypothetical protein
LDLQAFEPSLSHASFDKAWMPPEAFRDVYRESNAQLALAAKEGARFACMEYLMCGLPVVTTRNRGGQNRYLNPFNSRFVTPRPGAVARAVAEFVAAPPDPLTVREDVLALVLGNRLVYLDILRRDCRVLIHRSEATSIACGAVKMALSSMPFRSRSSLPRSPNVSQNIYFRGLAVYVT